MLEYSWMSTVLLWATLLLFSVMPVHENYIAN